MNDQPDTLPNVPNKTEKLGCYSRMYWADARVFTPADKDQLRAVLAFASENGRRVTVRGGEHSFDRQSLGNDIVISMAKFNDVEWHPGTQRLRVEPGATWGAILDELEPVLRIPKVTVTTCHATAGGTLSGDCLSRFSPAWGKEGTQITRIEFMTVDGQEHVLTPPGRNVPPMNWTPEQRMFSGVVGGLGYLGVVTKIEYEVLPVPGPGPIQVTTTMSKHDSFDGLAGRLVEVVAQTDLESSDTHDEGKLDGIYAALDITRGRKTALLFRSSVAKPGRKRRRLLIFWPGFVLRVPAEWLLRTRVGVSILWRLFYDTVSEQDNHYVDPFADYTFFMDGNVRAKHAGEALGRKMQTIQQTFVVPGNPRTEPDKAEQNLTKWLNYSGEYLAERGLKPAMFDVMWLPEDHLFPLSATAKMAGFAVSYAFETSNPGKQGEIKKAFLEMSEHLWSNFHGRVYLVKNVHVDPPTLQAMYGTLAERFFELKEKLDPNCTLRNQFLDDTFKEMLHCPQALAPPPPAAVPETDVVPS